MQTWYYQALVSYLQVGGALWECLLYDHYGVHYVESKVDTSPKEHLLVKGQQFAVNG